MEFREPNPRYEFEFLLSEDEFLESIGIDARANSDRTFKLIRADRHVAKMRLIKWAFVLASVALAGVSLYRERYLWAIFWCAAALFQSRVGVSKALRNADRLSEFAVRHTKQSLDSGLLRPLLPASHRIGALGIESWDELTHSLLSWRMIDRVAATPRLILVYYTPTLFVTFPRRCFASHEESEQFLADAEAWLKAARATHPPPFPVGPSEVVRFE